MKKQKILLSVLIKIIPAFFFILAVLAFLPIHTKAKDLDEILAYEITVDVNKDGTLNMLYHIEWKVLDSTSDGPLTWVKIGIPNKKYVSYKAISPSIKKISYDGDGGSYLRLDLDKKYYADEVVVMDFELVQDYMYQMNLLND